MQAVLSAAELARRGRAVVFLAARGTRAAREAAARGIEVRPILSPRHAAPVAIARAAVLFRRRGVRLVHAEYSKDLWTLVPAARLAGGVPVLLTKRLASSVDKKDPIHRWLHGETARVIAISSAIKENLQKRTTIPAERILVIPNGVDAKRFAPGRPDRDAARAELGIPPGGTAVGLVGRISRGKGQIEFVRGAALLRRDFPEARFVMVGDVTAGEEKYGRAVQGLVRELGLEDIVRFAGFAEDVPRLLGAFDLLVVPSRSEALGNVVLEGMAAGVPIAAAGAAGIRDLVVDGETGILFPPDDPKGLAASVRRLLGDEALRRAMGAAGRERAVRLYDRSKRTDRIEALYDEVLREREAGIAPPGSGPHPGTRRVFTNRHGLLRVPWRLALFPVPVAAILAALTALLSPVFSAAGRAEGAAGLRDLPFPLLFAGYAAAILSVLGGSALLLRLFDRRPFASLGLGLHEAWARELLAGGFLGALLISGVVGILAATGVLSLAPSPMEPAEIVRSALLNLALFALVALSEELIFRGYPLQVLAEGIGRAPAAFVLSGLFGLIHLFNEGGTGPGAVATGAAGLLLSLAYFRTKSLWLPIGIHTTWNWFLGWVYSLPVSGETVDDVPFVYEWNGPAWMTGGSFGPEAGLPAFVGMALLAFVLARSGRFSAARRAAEWHRPPEERRRAPSPEAPPEDGAADGRAKDGTADAGKDAAKRG